MRALEFLFAMVILMWIRAAIFGIYAIILFLCARRGVVVAVGWARSDPSKEVRF